jgi:hypothetical protein
MLATLDTEAPDQASARPPKPGVAGSNPAGGAQKSRILASYPSTSRFICPISDVNFIARLIARGIVARILLVRMVARDAPAVVEYRRLSQDAAAVRAGTVPVTGTVWSRRSVPDGAPRAAAQMDLSRAPGASRKPTACGRPLRARSAPGAVPALRRRRRVTGPPAWHHRGPVAVHQNPPSRAGRGGAPPRLTLRIPK